MIGEKLTKLRRQNGMTQQELSKRLHISCKSVKNWESDISDPNLKNIIALCDIFHISADDLLGINCETVSLSGLCPDDLRLLKQIIQLFIDCHE